MSTIELFNNSSMKINFIGFMPENGVYQEVRENFHMKLRLAPSTSRSVVNIEKKLDVFYLEFTLNSMNTSFKVDVTDKSLNRLCDIALMKIEDEINYWKQSRFSEASV